MKEAIISIRGVISSGGYDFLTGSLVPDSYNDAYYQLQSQAPFTSIRAEIDSPGGEVSTGRAIRMLFSSQKVPVTTVALSQCCSIATEIFSIGQHRIIMKGCDFMIHKPYGMVGGNEDDLMAYLEMMKNATAEMVELYMAVTGKSESVVRSWLVRDKSMTAEQALKLGFATEVSYAYPFNQPDETVQAYTKREPLMAFNQTTSMEKNPFQAISESLTAMKNELLSALSPTKTKALALTSMAGLSVDVETSENQPATGDSIKVDGEKPENGDVTISDGQILTVIDGKISEIKAPEEVKPTLDAEKEAEIAALKAELEAIKAEKQAKEVELSALKTSSTAQLTALNAKVEEIGKSIHSTYNPESRKFEAKQESSEEDREAKSNDWKKKELESARGKK